MINSGWGQAGYDHDHTSQVASFIETNQLLNSVILDSARGARFMALDTKDFFLQTIMKEYEYMEIYSKYFNGKMKLKYNLQNKITIDNYIYCRNQKGMYDLKQAARLVYNDLVLHLQEHGYFPDKICQNIWSHKMRIFFLSVQR